MFLRILWFVAIVYVQLADSKRSKRMPELMPLNTNEGATSLLQFSDLSGTTNEPVWKNLRDATIVASSSLDQYSLPGNLKGIHHNIWVSASADNQWLTFKFLHSQTIDGMRVWNIMTGSAFNRFLFQMSENDGHDWYDIEEGNGLDQQCCDFQEIFFPIAHANMFKLNMFDNHGKPDPLIMTSLSYIEFHFLPEPDFICPYYAVPYNNFCYAVMDRTLYSKYSQAHSTCQTTNMKLPIGWHLATHSLGVVQNVVTSAYTEKDRWNHPSPKYHWGTNFIVFKNGEAYNTKTGVIWTVGNVPQTAQTSGFTSSISAVQDQYHVPASQCTGCDSALCAAKLMMQIQQNSTKRFTPPFVDRLDSNNNLVFENI